MNITTTGPVGARVTGTAIGRIDAGMTRCLVELLAQHGVLSFPDQQVDDTDFVAFLRCFGELTFTVGETPVDGFDDLNIVTNVGRSSPPRSTFHTDTSYVRTPPAYTALRAVEVPGRGGDTLFTNQYRSAETLPAAMLDHLRGRTMTHVMSGLVLDDGVDTETSADHLILRPHPISGRETLFLSTPERCVAIEGMDAEESAETVGHLFEHSTAPDNIGRHSWEPGDVVMWDNRCVLHKADHSDVDGDRVMHRGMVADAGIAADV